MRKPPPDYCFKCDNGMNGYCPECQGLERCKGCAEWECDCVCEELPASPPEPFVALAFMIVRAR